MDWSINVTFILDQMWTQMLAKTCILNDSRTDIYMFRRNPWSGTRAQPLSEPLMHYIIVRYCTHKASYSPQTKLWEGNIFTGVCLSTRRGVVPSHHNPLDYTIPGLYPVPPGPYLLRTIPTQGPYPQTPSPRTTKAVHILLECFLAFVYILPLLLIDAMHFTITFTTMVGLCIRTLDSQSDFCNINHIYSDIIPCLCPKWL